MKSLSFMYIEYVDRDIVTLQTGFAIYFCEILSDQK